VVEEGVDRDWLRAEAPAIAWHESFATNHGEIVAERAPTAGLFDRLITATGLAADMCGWLDAADDAATQPPTRLHAGSER
jgi:hypothetical protein